MSLGDTVQFLGLTASLTYALVDAPMSVVLTFLAWGAVAGKDIFRDAYAGRAGWFEVAKLAGGLVGMACLFAGAPAWILRLVLALNMIEAIVWDVSCLNALVGVALVGVLYVCQLEPLALPLTWVLAYTVWNAIFSHGYGYSPSTRAILATALIVHLASGRPWLACRCISMVANMVLRATYPSTGLRVYTPGASWLTRPL